MLFYFILFWKKNNTPSRMQKNKQLKSTLLLFFNLLLIKKKKRKKSGFHIFFFFNFKPAIASWPWDYNWPIEGIGSNTVVKLSIKLIWYLGKVQSMYYCRAIKMKQSSFWIKILNQLHCSLSALKSTQAFLYCNCKLRRVTQKCRLL